MTIRLRIATTVGTGLLLAAAPGLALAAASASAETATPSPSATGVTTPSLEVTPVPTQPRKNSAEATVAPTGAVKAGKTVGGIEVPAGTGDRATGDATGDAALIALVGGGALVVAGGAVVIATRRRP